MASTKNFFEKKHEWSTLKDDLLNNYLPPYLEKIKKFNSGIAIFDCFAGKGKFDDGSEGSPFIILRNISQSKASVSSHAYLIEQKYGDVLESNIQCFNGYYTLYKDTYESNISTIQSICHDKNIFLYIDPYGIKSLDFVYFEKFKASKPRTIELLLNFNTFGFLREGCRLLNDTHITCDESEVDYESDENNTRENMNSVANGDYWQRLVNSYYHKEMDLKKAEISFAESYSSELQKVFKYVINVPIKDKVTNIPKYRMFYGTNSSAGLFLMVDQMHKAWDKVLHSCANCQCDLFEDKSEYSISSSLKVFTPISIENELLQLLKKNESISMKEYFIEIINKCGITYSCGEYRTEIGKLEQAGKITVCRSKPLTDNGRPSKALDFEKQEILIKRK